VSTSVFQDFHSSYQWHIIKTLRAMVRFNENFETHY